MNLGQNLGRLFDELYSVRNFESNYFSKHL